MVLRYLIQNSELGGSSLIGAMNMNDVKQLIEKYVEGTRTGNVEILKSVFHPNAIMSGDLGENKLQVGTPEIFFNDINGKRASEDYSWSIDSIDCHGEIAIASLKEHNLHGQSFINQFHLQKADGEWKIISKLFTTLGGC